MLRICLTGSVAVSSDRVLLEEQDLGGRQARLVLALLTGERHRAVHHEEIADALWPQGLPATWEPALRGVVSKVRAFLAKAGLPADKVVTSAFGCYQLHLPEGADVDLEEAFGSVQAADDALARVELDAACDQAEAARDVLMRPFLAGEEGEWVESRRAEIRGRLVRALDVLTQASMRRGELVRAVETAEEGVELEPFREAAYTLLMQAHAADGNRGEALRAYERCRRLLVDELGVDPSPDLQAAHLSLLTGEDMARVLPEHRVAAAEGNLPAPLTSFVGRERELSEIRKLVRTERLLTLTGAGGCGKTRLALEVGRLLRDACRDGVWLVDVAPIAAPDLVAHAVADALGVREQPGRTLLEAVSARIRTRELLLVLDNCEHLVAACAGLAHELLSSCPGLRVLATSREVLGVPGEVSWRVPSLSVPDPSAASAMESLLDFEAPRLFVERAHQARPDVSLDDADASALAAISVRLDGIPLAIELAAARAAVMSVREIASRLEDRFRLLTAGHRTAVPRHQTLRAAVEWSYELLDPSERRLLRAISVFAGGFTLEAAEAVALMEPDGAQVLDVLGRLVSKSLVECEVSGGESRYRLLETIRAYGREALADEGEDTAVRDAHLEWSVDLARRDSDEPDTEARAMWTRRLDGEIDNLRSALEWAVSQGRSDAALRLSGELANYWYLRGAYVEGRRWLSAALSMSDGASPRLRARALWGLGALSALGPLTDVLSTVEECVAVSREGGDDRDVARALSLLAYVRLLMDPNGVRPLLDEALALARKVDDWWGVAYATCTAGWLEFYRGDAPRARPWFEECITLAETYRDALNLRQGLAGLGLTEMLCGDYARARGYLLRGLKLTHDLSAVTRAQMLCYLGETARLSGDYAESRTHLEEAADIGRRAGTLFLRSIPPGLLGRLALSEGDAAGARPLLQEALSQSQAMSLSNMTCWWLQGLGEAARALGDSAAAREYLDDAVRLARQIGNRREEARALWSQARLALEAGNASRAESLLREAVPLLRAVGDVPGLVDALETLAYVVAELGRHELSASLLGLAQAHRDAFGFAQHPAEQTTHEAELVHVRDALGDDVFNGAWAEGAQMPLEDAVTGALTSVD